jgi:hypothetical protein
MVPTQETGIPVALGARLTDVPKPMVRTSLKLISIGLNHQFDQCMVTTQIIAKFLYDGSPAADSKSCLHFDSTHIYFAEDRCTTPPVKYEKTWFRRFIGPGNGLVVLLPCEKVIAFHLTAVSERGNSMKMKASSDILAT